MFNSPLLTQLAQQAGITEEEAAQKINETIPGAVAPDGTVDEAKVQAHGQAQGNPQQPPADPNAMPPAPPGMDGGMQQNPMGDMAPPGMPMDPNAGPPAPPADPNLPPPPQAPQAGGPMGDMAPPPDMPGQPPQMGPSTNGEPTALVDANGNPTIAPPPAAGASSGTTDGSPQMDANGVWRSPDVQKPESQHGFWNKLTNRPGSAEALMALGASLMSSQNFFTGLGNGMLAYQKTLDAAQRADRPQTTMVQGGAFAQTTDTVTGRTTLSPVKSVQDYVDGRDLTKGMMAYNVAKARIDGMSDIAIRTQFGLTQRELMQIDSAQKIAKGHDAKDLTIASGNNRTTIEAAGIAAASRVAAAEATGSAKQTPAAAIKHVDDLTEIANGVDNSLANIDPVIGDLQSGKLKFSLASNAYNAAAMRGLVPANENTVAYSNYQRTVNELVNGLLIANKGVQTEGDALRARLQVETQAGNMDVVANTLAAVRRDLTRRSQQYRHLSEGVSRQYHLDPSLSVNGSTVDGERSGQSYGGSYDPEASGHPAAIPTHVRPSSFKVISRKKL